MILSVQHFSIWSSTEVGMRDEHTKEMGRKKNKGQGETNKQKHTWKTNTEREIFIKID